MRNTESRIEHLPAPGLRQAGGLNTDVFRAGGCRSSRVPSSGKLADRGGELRPHPGPLPQERELPLQPTGHRFASASFLDRPSTEGRRRPGAEPGNCGGESAPVAAHDSTAAAISPSPGGEGWGEGGTSLQFAQHVANRRQRHDAGPHPPPSAGGDCGSAQRQGEGGTFGPLPASVAPFFSMFHPCFIRG